MDFVLPRLLMESFFVLVGAFVGPLARLGVFAFVVMDLWGAAGFYSMAMKLFAEGRRNSRLALGFHVAEELNSFFVTAFLRNADVFFLDPTFFPPGQNKTALV